MATLAVWQFDAADDAGLAADALTHLRPDDAALVEWPAGDRRPRTRQLVDGGLDAGFWGLFFGLVFFVPLLGAAIGTTTGALAGALTDVGIDDHFINRVRDQVTPGTSALFVLTSAAEVGRLRDALAAGPPPELISTVLDVDQEAALREVFGT